MSLVEMKDFSALIDNKPFSDQPVKNNKKRMRKYHEKMIIQQKIYQIICIIKNILNSLVQIYQDKQIQVLYKKINYTGKLENDDCYDGYQ